MAGRTGLSKFELSAFLRAHTPKTRTGWLLASFAAGALILTLVGAVRTLAPVLSDWTTWGGHDWDEISAQRYITVKALREYGELPFWNPYACGGHSAWANVQGAPNLVSPFLPFYLLFDLRTALRLELLSLTLIGVSGAWLFAGRFTKSRALCGLVAVVFALNGRFAMQAATGHAWHNYYAFMPWIFYAFERANEETRPLFSRYALLGALLVAFLVYAGAIYPLPHTLALLAVYALALSVIQRRVRPLGIAALIATSGLLFAAPKLLPSLEQMSRFPRLVESTEFVELRTLIAALTAPEQTPGARPAPIPQWGWHEYGMYIGWLPFFGLFLAVAARETNERAARYAALVALVLGLGAFHEYSPWTLVHQLPLFASQHVPSRWLYPALLLFSVCAVGVVERTLARTGERRWIFEGVLVLALGYVAFDVSGQSQLSTSSAFWMKMRRLPEPGAFFQVKRVPRALEYTGRDYAPPALPAMMTNRGVIDCTLMAALNIWAPKDAHGRVQGIGAVGRDERTYRGEAFVDDAGPDSNKNKNNSKNEDGAKITRFSPNHVSVAVHQAPPGTFLVLNQNYDPGWYTNVGTAINRGGRVAVALPHGDTTVRFSYRPWGLGWGLALTLLSTGAWFGLPRSARLRATWLRAPWPRAIAYKRPDPKSDPA